MDSSDGAKKYPIKLYAEGKSPLQNKSMNHNCQLGNFSRVKEAIGDDAWDDIKKSSLGLIPKLVDSNYVWSSKTVHFLLTRQLSIKNANEIWVVVGGQPIRFSLHEFAEITGLKTDALPLESCEADYTSFWIELGVPHGLGPKFDELSKSFGKCRGWDISKRKMLGFLCILHMGIHGIHHNSRMPLETAQRVFKEEDIADYPWGRVAFKSLIDGVQLVQYERKSYTVNGCVHVLLIWAYESINVFGERFGRKYRETGIPFLRWGGNRTRDDLEKVISKEIEQRGEVRVRRMIMKPLDEIYPTWDDENEDIEVQNLIVDILEKKFVKGYWDVKQVESSRKKLKGKNVDKSEHPKKDKRKKRSSGDEEKLDEEGPVKKKKADDIMKESQVIEKKKADDIMKESQVIEDFETGATSSGLIQVIDKLITRFDGRFDGVEQNMSNLVLDLEGKLQVKFDGYDHRITSVEEKVVGVEDKVGVVEDKVEVIDDKVNMMANEIKWLKERIPPREMENSNPNDGNSKLFQEEEVTSPLKPSPTNVPEEDDNVLLKEVVKRKLKVKKTLVNEDNKEKKGNEDKKKDKVQKVLIDLSDKVKVKEEKLTKKYDINQGKKIGIPSLKDTSDLLDITDVVAAEENNLLAESEDNEEEMLRQAKLNVALGQVLQADILVGEREKKNWPAPPPYPMVGPNGFSLMRKGVVPSKAIYNPLKPVDQTKIEKVREFLRSYE